MHKILFLTAFCLITNVVQSFGEDCEVWSPDTHYTMQDKVIYYDQGYECIVYDVWYWPPTDTRFWAETDQCDGAGDGMGGDWDNGPVYKIRSFDLSSGQFVTVEFDDGDRYYIELNGLNIEKSWVCQLYLAQINPNITLWVRYYLDTSEDKNFGYPGKPFKKIRQVNTHSN